MNEIDTSVATAMDSRPVDAAAAVPSEAGPVEFVGSSDHTIAEAVRRALSRASASLRTLDGVGVVVIPHIDRCGNGPRFHVTLRVSASVATHS